MKIYCVQELYKIDEFGCEVLLATTLEEAQNEMKNYLNHMRQYASYNDLDIVDEDIEDNTFKLVLENDEEYVCNITEFDFGDKLMLKEE